MFKKMSKKKKLVLLILFCTLLAIRSYSYLRYSGRYNIIVINNSNSSVDYIYFSTRNDEVKGIELTDIAPHETINISRQFNKVSEKFVVIIDTPQENKKVIPLAYIYSPNSKNIIKIVINKVEDNKISQLSIKSFDNFFKITPWWIRALYDYETIIYNDN